MTEHELHLQKGLGSILAAAPGRAEKNSLESRFPDHVDSTELTAELTLAKAGQVCRSSLLQHLIVRGVPCQRFHLAAMADRGIEGCN